MGANSITQKAQRIRPIITTMKNAKYKIGDKVVLTKKGFEGEHGEIINIHEARVKCSKDALTEYHILIDGDTQYWKYYDDEFILDAKSVEAPELFKKGDHVYSILENKEYDVVELDGSGHPSARLKDKNNFSFWTSSDGKLRPTDSVAVYHKMGPSPRYLESVHIPALPPTIKPGTPVLVTISDSFKSLIRIATGEFEDGCIMCYEVDSVSKDHALAWEKWELYKY